MVEKLKKLQMRRFGYNGLMFRISTYLITLWVIYSGAYSLIIIKNWFSGW